jgi:hypothetical protein
MAVKSNFNAAESLKELMAETEKIHQLIIEAMTQAGEEFVKASREQPGDHAAGFYEDVTTNLRNSVQYMIFKDGELLKGSNSKFSAQNRTEILDLVKQQGFQLIGIAGMNYASAVESKGYNVISLQADQCIVDLSNYVKNIEKYVNG